MELENNRITTRSHPYSFAEQEWDGDFYPIFNDPPREPNP